MRDDIKYVVIERPRSMDSWELNSPRIPKRLRNSLKRIKLDYDPDEGFECEDPKHLPMSMYGKNLSDFLAPLEGFFRKSVGRKFDDVWSELASKLKGNSVTNLHVLGHAKDYVIRKSNIEERDGKVYEINSRFGSYLDIQLKHDELYENSDGIICRYVREDRVTKAERFSIREIQRYGDIHFLHNKLFCKLDKKNWFVLYPEDHSEIVEYPIKKDDGTTFKNPDGSDKKRIYKRKRDGLANYKFDMKHVRTYLDMNYDVNYDVSKYRQLSKREIRKYGLP